MYRSAKAYDRYIGRWSRRLAPLFVEYARIGDGDAVLDVGSGTGSLTAAIVEGAKPSTVVGVEPAVGLMRHARRRVADPRVRFVEGDARRLPFPDASFSASLTQLVLHGVHPAADAVREMCRVTRRGGVLAACEWDFCSEMEMFRIVWDTLVDVDPEAEPRHARHIPYGGRGQLLRLWQDCGIQEATETTFRIPLTFANFDDFWLPLRNAPSSAWEHLRNRSPRVRRNFQTRLKAALLDGTGDGPITLCARAWGVRGIAP